MSAAVDGVQAHAEALQRRMRADARLPVAAVAAAAAQNTTAGGSIGFTGTGSQGMDFLRGVLAQWKVWETATVCFCFSFFFFIRAVVRCDGQ